MREPAAAGAAGRAGRHHGRHHPRLERGRRGEGRQRRRQRHRHGPPLLHPRRRRRQAESAARPRRVGGGAAQPALRFAPQGRPRRAPGYGGVHRAHGGAPRRVRVRLRVRADAGLGVAGRRRAGARGRGARYAGDPRGIPHFYGADAHEFRALHPAPRVHRRHGGRRRGAHRHEAAPHDGDLWAEPPQRQQKLSGRGGPRGLHAHRTCEEIGLDLGLLEPGKGRRRGRRRRG
mmetsp:Transcript_4941/g.13971  ORF Transcript_4941/g.13971 Transcript_4941/m.13971 type:complete len:232 (-) Transcript_4941:2014-2709(-)